MSSQTRRPHPLSIETPALEPPSTNQALFSPVNEHGIFEFDTVLKSGQVLKRRKRTKNWDTVRLVLRPNILSIYKDANETKLKHQINLSEVSAVAVRKDRKRKGEHAGVFGVFSPARNFHLEADSEAEAQAWVEQLRKEAHIDDQQEELIVTSPGGTKNAFTSFGHRQPIRPPTNAVDVTRCFRASSELSDQLGRSSLSSRQGSFAPGSRPSHDLSDPSGSEVGSYPEMTDTPIFGSLYDIASSPRSAGRGTLAHHEEALGQKENTKNSTQRAQDKANFYQVGQSLDDMRVLWHGYVEYLKSNGAVRSWKKYWMVLRPKNLALYKSDEEYAALLIIPLSSILDAVETDPVAKGKQYCMQIITDDRSYRFSCTDEEELTKWLGALKAALSKKKETQARPP